MNKPTKDIHAEGLPQSAEFSGGHFGFVEVLHVLSRWKKFIALNVLVVTLLATAVSFLLPRWYKSTAAVLPPRAPNLMGMLSGTLSGVGGSSAAIMRQLGPLRALGAAPGVSDLYSYIAILKSRTLLERVVEEFDLINVYDISDRSMAKAIEELSSNADFKVNEEGTLEIVVSDRDPQRAARMANFFVNILDEFNRELTVRETRSQREFIERRVTQNEADLKHAEEALREFQEKQGVPAVTEQTMSALSGYAELYAKKELKELEVQFLQRTVSEDNPQLQAARLELKMLEGRIGALPEQGMAYLRLYRDFVVQQKLYETLLPLLEQARIEEQRNTPTLVVLDDAVVPDLPYKPRKRIIVLVFFFLSLFGSVGVSLFLERIDRLRRTSPLEYDRLIRSWKELTQWKRTPRSERS